MPRPATGTFEARRLVDGTRAFHLRFIAHSARELVVLHERAGCRCGCGGSWLETQARAELGNIQARLRAGVWERASSEPAGVSELLKAPTFEGYSRWWLAAKIEGSIGGKPISETTVRDYRWRLERHLLPFFGSYPLPSIDDELCQRFKAKKLRQAAEQRRAITAGAILRDERGRRIFPLKPASLRKLTSALAAILDEAAEDKHILRNPARTRRMHVHVPKPKRGFLEIDELVSLFMAAARQDQVLLMSEIPDGESTTALVGALAAQDMSPQRIARELSLARSTVSYHLKKLGVTPGRGYAGRRAIVEILGRAGPRVSELCDLTIGQVRIHDPHAGRFAILDAKTEAGVREVQLTPELTHTLKEHLERLKRRGNPTRPGDYLVQSLHDGRMSRQRVAQIVREAATLATEERAARGLPALPHTTPHTLRRTYVSIALLANGFDVKWVMSQVGHADSRMTLDVYAQLAQRVNRQHGIKFDHLVKTSPLNDSSGDEKATKHKNGTSTTNRNITIASYQ